MRNETLFRDGKMPVDESREYPLMKCGCVAMAVHHPDNAPACVIHICIEVDRMVKGNHGLEGRKAKCFYRHDRMAPGVPETTDSHWSLPFFEHKPDKEYDTFYCGCHGWD